MKKHTPRPQNSTIAGVTSLTGAILLIFSGVEIKDTLDVIADMKWDQLMPIIIIVAGSLRSILMTEKTKESIVNEIKAKKNESANIKTNTTTK